MFMSILKEQVIRIKLCLFRDGFEYEMSNDIFNRKVSPRRTRTKHINKRWFILAKQLNFDLTWIFHTKNAFLLAF